MAINWTDFNAKITPNFTLGENLQQDSRRLPTHPTVRSNILRVMTELQKIRDEWGKPIIITSGYRPAAINRAVGGARLSRHIVGDAVDIKPESGSDIYAFQAWLDLHWYGALGWGAKKGFVHLDCRNGNGWRTGGVKGVRFPY